MGFVLGMNTRRPLSVSTFKIIRANWKYGLIMLLERIARDKPLFIFALLSLMSNYASGQQVTGGLPEGRPLELLPSKPLPVITLEASPCGGSSGGATGSGGGKAEIGDEDGETCPKLFGVAIGSKRVRREDEDGGDSMHRPERQSSGC
ncbi:hypothetical protein RND81_13G040300 [Saponaria officinalis]|uniref:Uncharacterized protein n=1 Tax=Saponaria officinalis TaxID=3572 RepID=A0AAW1GTK9_SAPOF